MNEEIKETKTEVITKERKLSYKDATGEIEYTLKSDLVFHYTMQKSKRALIGLVCALRGIKPSEVQSVEVMNPIDLNSVGKESVMDLKLTLNNGVIMNIELQMYMDKMWIPRSILYVCRAFDCIKGGDDYSQLKETVHYCITDQNLFDTEPEFYAHYGLLNKKTHEPYSDMLGINVVQLQYIDMATQEDVDNGLVYWAKLFMASSWEEMQDLVQGHEDIEEVADLIFTLNTDNQAQEILEGQRRYREQMATQYAVGRMDGQKEAQQEIDELKTELDGAKTELDETKTELDAANQTIEELQARIAELEKKE